MSSMRLCSFLLLASALDFMAKPSQAAPIFAPGNYVVESGFDPEDTGTGPNAPGLLSSVPVQYIESPNLFQSTPLLDLGTTVKPDFKLDLAAIYQDLPFPIPLNTAPEMARWPYNPYCPLEDAYCCTGDYAPETNKFLEGCNPWNTSEVKRKAKRANCPPAQEYCCVDFLLDMSQGFDCIPGNALFIPGRLLPPT